MAVYVSLEVGDSGSTAVVIDHCLGECQAKRPFIGSHVHGAAPDTWASVQVERQLLCSVPVSVQVQCVLGQRFVATGVDGRGGGLQTKGVIRCTHGVVRAVGVHEPRIMFYVPAPIGPETGIPRPPTATGVLHQTVADGGSAVIVMDLGAGESGVAPQYGVGQRRAARLVVQAAAVLG